MAKSKKKPQTASQRNHTVKSSSKQKSRIVEDYRHRPGYSQIRIEGFRIFDSIVLENLGAINLLLGPNNSGKSSILEAVFAHACGLNFGPFRDQVLFRRHNAKLSGHLDFGEKIFSIFRRTDQLPFRFDITSIQIGGNNENLLRVEFAPSAELSELDPRNLGQVPLLEDRRNEPELLDPFSRVELSGIPPQFQTETISRKLLGTWTLNLSGKILKINESFPPVPIQSVHPFKLGHFQDILSHRAPEAEPRVFGHLKRYGVLEDFVSNMRKAFPVIREIDMIPFPDGRSGPLLVTTDDGRRLPLYAFGDGVRRWYSLLGNMQIYPNAIHCIEEIDATFHQGSQTLLSRLLLTHTQEFSNQIFATSHSIEYTDCFLDALFGSEGVVKPDDPDPVRVFTIRPKAEGLEVWSLSGREAYESRTKFRIELRS